MEQMLKFLVIQIREQYLGSIVEGAIIEYIKNAFRIFHSERELQLYKKCFTDSKLKKQLIISGPIIIFASQTSVIHKIVEITYKLSLILFACFGQQNLVKIYTTHRIGLYNHFMKNTISVVLVLALLTTVLTNTCTTPTAIVDSNGLSSVFDSTISLINYKPELLSLISSPSLDTIKTYLTTKAAFVIPLWCVGGLSFFFLIGCCLQICCYNCCNQKKCGTPISVKSFKPCILSCCVYTFMILSGLLMAAGIASFVISSDLLKQTNYSICNFNSTLTELFQGTQPGTMPAWSGVDNFNMFAEQISINFPNSIPTINSIFTSPSFTTVTSNVSNSPFNQAVTQYACPNTLTSSTVSCPFSDINKCVNASNTQMPVFSSQFCNESFTSSTAQLVSKEQQTNSTMWQQSLVSLSVMVADLTVNPIDFTQLVDQSSQLQSSITTYQPQMYSGIQVASDNINTAQIGLYAVIGFFVLMGLLSFLSICCVYCTRNFKCRYLLYILWILFAFMAVIFFIISGVLMLGTLVAYDSCAAYNQLTTNQTALQSLPYYSSGQAFKTLDTCFYPPPDSTNSIFDSFTQNSNFVDMSQLQSLYLNSLPSTSFASVSTIITNKLIYYAANPNQVNLQGATTSQNPQQALNDANSYASNGGSATCNAVHDTLTYNPNNCYPSVIQNTGISSCILIQDSSIAVVNGRQSSFNTNNCSANFATYKNNFDPLNTFGTEIKTLTNSYLQDTGLGTYSTSYFNYYNLVRTFMNSYVQSLFENFLKPYQSLVGGSSCTYLTTSLNNLVDNTCNNNFPYIYALTVLVILMSCFFFLMMIFAYFLTVRMEFYEYLSGDLNNYEEAGDNNRLEIELAEMSSTNRQKLLPAPALYNQGYSPEKYAPAPQRFQSPQRNFYAPYPSPYSQYPPPSPPPSNQYSYGKKK